MVVLGGGPAGVGAAYRLRTLDRADVTVIERSDGVGGNAGSFEHRGHRLDFGSHRLHPTCDREILDDIRRLLGDDLLDRPRHGRIRLRGRWIHFPLRPLDLLLRLDRRFALGAAVDAVRTRFSAESDGDETFASVLEANLGPTICRDFYFPYARKIWGEDPDALSAEQARRRVSAGSFGTLLRKVLRQVPGVRSGMTGRFYYPREGYGQISEALADEARRLGADIRLGWTASGLVPPSDAGAPWTVRIEADGRTETLEADQVWSTIPITVLARIVEGEVPARVVEAARSLRFRAMVLVYLELETDRFTGFDAHYFPGTDVRISRLSEPKVYADRTEPRGRTVLCAELPCSKEDDVWGMGDEELGERVAEDLERAELPLAARRLAVWTRRLPQAYPIYLQGYGEAFGVLDAWAGSLPRLLSFGRQGLFAHDNTHHALYMAYAAVDSLTPEGYDAGRWAEYRQVFETHVVED